jgi:hypothetical protein
VSWQQAGAPAATATAASSSAAAAGRKKPAAQLQRSDSPPHASSSAEPDAAPSRGGAAPSFPKPTVSKRLPWEGHLDSGRAGAPSTPALSETGHHISIGVGDDLETGAAAASHSSEEFEPRRSQGKEQHQQQRHGPHHGHGHGHHSNHHHHRDSDHHGHGSHSSGRNHSSSSTNHNQRFGALGNQSPREEDVLLELGSQHGAIMAQLSSRLTNIRLVRSFWAAGDMKGAIECLHRIKDRAVLVDFVRVLRQVPQVLTLDVCVAILPELVDLLGSPYDDYVVPAVEVLGTIVSHFGPIVRDARNHAGKPRFMVDVAREERAEKCDKCYEHLSSVRFLIEDIARRSRIAAAPCRVYIKAYDQCFQSK